MNKDLIQTTRTPISAGRNRFGIFRRTWRMLAAFASPRLIALLSLAALLLGAGKARADDPVEGGELRPTKDFVWQWVFMGRGQMQDFTVPAGFEGRLSLQVDGGDGGRGRTSDGDVYPGGPGARVLSSFRVGSGGDAIPGGSTLRFIIGQSGESPSAGSGGGGAGTAAYFRPPGAAEWQLLVGAGGGGGAEGWSGAFEVSDEGFYGRYNGDGFGAVEVGGNGDGAQGGLYFPSLQLGFGGSGGDYDHANGDSGGGGGTLGQGGGFVYGTIPWGGGAASPNAVSPGGGTGHVSWEISVGGAGWGGGGVGQSDGGGGGGISGGAGGIGGGGGGGGSFCSSSFGAAIRQIGPRSSRTDNRLSRDGEVKYILSPLYLLAPESIQTGDAAGLQLVEITEVASPVEPWTATSNVSWLSVLPQDASGLGSGFARIFFEENPGGSRTGTVTIGGQTFTVRQGGVDTVTTTGDSGAGSLRQVIADAVPGSVIVFDGGLSGATIELSSGELNLDKNLTIDASDLPGGVTIDANGDVTGHRVMQIGAGVSVSLNSLTLTGGQATGTGESGKGGGIYSWGNLVVKACRIVANSAEYGGGIALYPSSNLQVVDTTVADNSATVQSGGGIWGSGQMSIRQCVFVGNHAASLGGAVAMFDSSGSCTLDNCTITGNTAGTGSGGVYGCTLNNSIVYGNVTPLITPNHSSSTINHSCTWPLPTTGVGNIAVDPRFVNAAARDYHLSAGSPCLNVGDNSAVGTRSSDLDGNPRIADGLVDMGVFERPGVQIYYVSTSGDDTANGYSWATAKRTIQGAVDVTVDGCTVMVGEGVYDTGSRVVHGAMHNRVVVDKAITVMSLNGPDVTTIEGAPDPENGLGDGAVRGAYIGAGAQLIGFTLTNGATRTAGDENTEQSGGGVWCASDAVVVNCTITNNEAAVFGGGSSGGTLINCRLTGNLAEMLDGSNGGGASRGTLENCVVSGNVATNGGGTFSCTLEGCTVSGNRALDWGGGVRGGVAYNCTVTGNRTDFQDGGGAYQGELFNCVLTSNDAQHGGGADDCVLVNCTVAGNNANEQGGGVVDCTLTNSIVYFNSASVEPTSDNHLSSTFDHSCTTPLPAGTDNISDDPEFLDFPARDFRLRPGSPCIDAGENAGARGIIVNGTVDMGALESNGGYAAWAAAITNGLTGENDSALGDGYPNLVKYATGSSATESDGLARHAVARTNGVVQVLFNFDPDALDVTMYVEASDNLSPGSWAVLATRQLGAWGPTDEVVEIGGSSPVAASVEDPAAGATSRYYRLRVTRP